MGWKMKVVYGYGRPVDMTKAIEEFIKKEDLNRKEIKQELQETKGYVSSLDLSLRMTAKHIEEELRKGDKKMSITVSDHRSPQWLKKHCPYGLYNMYEVIVNGISLGTYANDEMANQKALLYPNEDVLIKIDDATYVR